MRRQVCAPEKWQASIAIAHFSDWNNIARSPLIETIEGMSMPSGRLKRAERAIQATRDQAELPPEAADALQELVDVVRAIEGCLSVR